MTTRQYVFRERNCPRCEGTGRLGVRGDIDKPCPVCHEEGTVEISLYASCRGCGHIWAAHHGRELYPTTNWFTQACCGGDCPCEGFKE